MLEKASSAVECEEVSVRPLREEVVMHCGKEEVEVHAEDGGSWSSKDLAAEAVGENASERKNHVEGAVVFCFGHAPYTITGEQTVESGGIDGRENADVKADGRRWLSNDG